MRNHPLLHIPRHPHLLLQRLRLARFLQQSGVFDRRRRLRRNRFQQVYL